MATAQAEPPMPPANASFRVMWAYIKEGLDFIMMDNSTGLSRLRYMNLRTSVYNYCVSSRMRLNLDDSIHLEQQDANLYDKLDGYLVTHLITIRSASDLMTSEALLRYYAEEWDRYTTGAKYLSRVFAYLDAHWVKRERAEGRKDIYPIYTLALLRWRQTVLLHKENRQTNAASAILKVVESQRNGEMVDQSPIRTVIESFVTLGFDEESWDLSASLDLYKEQFEDPFIDATENYYKSESKSLLSTSTFSHYLRRVEGRLREEEERIERYLNANMRKLLMSTCINILVNDHIDLMWDYIHRLRAYDEDEDIQRMYALLSLIPGEHERLEKEFEDSVARAGQLAISNLVDEGANVDSLELEGYVDALLQVYLKKHPIVQRSFRNEKSFVAAFDKGCRKFINKNAITSNSTTRLSELLAKYLDTLLRKSNKIVGDGELEGAFDRVTILLKYIDDKDVFHSIYTTKLSKRLIHSVSVSEEAEASMISRLKDTPGFDHADGLQRMLLDMNLSKDLTDQFKEHIQVSGNSTGGDTNFGIMVLGSNCWPLKAPNHKFIIPPEILPTHERFVRFFHDRNAARKLIWLWNYSTNELSTNYLNQEYTFRVSSYQMSILLQYNANDTLSLNELMDATGITRDLLSQVLSVLVKAKILINDEDSDQYDLNPNFKSKKNRLNLNLPIRAQVIKEATDVLRTVEEDRKYVIQATIIRIMKARNTLSSQALIQEVVAQLSRRFTPKVPDIKKAIDSLLEKDYIKRDEGHHDIFNYVA